MTKNDEIKKRAETEPDFINSRRYGYSLKKYIAKNSKSPNSIISHFLGITKEEVEEYYQSAVKKIRQKLKIDV